MRKIFRFGILMTTVLFGTFSGLTAQDVNTLYFMKGVPQISGVNPAFQPDCDLFIGFPGIAPLQVIAESSSFAMNDIVKVDAMTDSLKFRDPEDILALLKDRNTVDDDFSTSLLTFGFRTPQETYITFDISERVTVAANYPIDLLRLPVYGPDSAMTYNFDGLGVNMSSFSQFSLGISQKLGDRLSVGIKGKLLFGQANLTIKKFDFGFTSNEDFWPIHSDVLLNASVPFADIAYTEDGFVDFDNSSIPDNIERRIPRLAINPRNFGLAVDIGGDFRVNDWLELSASLVDLGKIRWNDGLLNLTNKAEFDYYGVEYLSGDEDWLEAFGDTLDAVFNKFTTTEDSYSTWLPAKLYAGASFYVHPKISFGILSRTTFYNKQAHQQFTASANFYPIRLFSGTISYSIINNSFQNLGIGLSFNPRPFNLYIVSDTAPSVCFWPLDARYLNLKIGLNLVFGCKKAGKSYDKPLVD